MKFYVLIACFVFSTGVISQNLQWTASAEALGIFSTQENVPFWFQTNTFNSVGKTTSFSSSTNVAAVYSFNENALLTIGSSLMVRNGVEQEVQFRDLFLTYKNSWLQATLGAKAFHSSYTDLSASDKNFLYSGNARPLPGLLVEASKPLKISSTFFVDWGIAQYQLNDDRYIDKVRVHYKRLGLISRLTENSALTLRIQHYAQWGGVTPDGTQLQNDFNAFARVFIATKGGDYSAAGESANALGNHLGSYFVEYETSLTLGLLKLYHDHPFEDGSGTRLANFPDGIWGVSFAPDTKKLFTEVTYEYIASSDQSGNTDGTGFDGYFGNNIYRSGWTYEGQVIGLPFILNDTSIVLTETNSPFVSNRSRVHHLGIKGAYKNFDWMLKSSYVTNLGTYRRPFQPTVTNWYNFATVAYRTERFGNITILGGLDTSNLSGKLAAVGLQYTYQF